MKNDFNIKFLAGIFFIAGIIGIFVFIFTIGHGKGLAQPKFQLPVFFKNVGGLTIGAPVRLSGVVIGNVSSIDFSEEEWNDQRIKVTLDILTKYEKQLENGTHFAIKTEGILGEKLIEIYISSNEQKIDFTQPIVGQDPMDIQDLAEVFAKAAQSFTKTAEELGQVDMLELAEVMRDSSEALLVTAEGFNEILGELKEITRKSKRLFDRLEQRIIDGNLFRVF